MAVCDKPGDDIKSIGEWERKENSEDGGRSQRQKIRHKCFRGKEAAIKIFAAIK